MKALISPNEQVVSFDSTPLGSRVAQVSATEFEVAPPFFWVDCGDIGASEHYFDTADQSIKTIPVPSPSTMPVDFGAPVDDSVEL